MRPRPVFAALLLIACAALVFNFLQLWRLTDVPWTYVGATLDVNLVPTLTLTPSPLPSTPTRTPRPTRVPRSGDCAQDQITFGVTQPALGSTVLIGRTRVSIVIQYCLRSQAQAKLYIGLLSADNPNLILVGESKLIANGQDEITRQLNWVEFTFNPILPGQYRWAALLQDEFGNTLLSVATVEEYSFVPPPTPTPTP